MHSATEELCHTVVEKVIADLQDIAELCFGEDTGLTNFWEEICVQRQGDMSVVWEEVYALTVRVLIEAHLEDLSAAERQMIWLETDQGSDWQCEDECEEGFAPPVFNPDIVNYLSERVYWRADQFSNDSITAFLVRNHEPD